MSRYRGIVQRTDARLVGKAAGDAGSRAGVVRHAALLAGLLGPTAWLLIGCGSSEDLVTTAVAPAGLPVGNVSSDTPLSPGSEMQSAKLDVTPAQRAFLDALSGAGVHPSSELQALSIGSSVCQARAAGQSDQAVWDYIAPMVRSDVDSGAEGASSPGPSDVQLNAVTSNYIRIAKQRLC